jgi:hypothetical protein
MEHFLFHLVLEAIQWADRRLQKPLAKAVPDVALLRTDPRVYLSQTTVEFGPRRRHVLAAVVGLAAGGAVVAVLFFVFKQMPKPKQPDPTRGVGMIVSFIVTTLAVRALMLRLFVGGTMSLVAHGVELTHRGWTVFMPWELFRAPGGVFEPDHKLVVLPADPRVPVAVYGPDDRVEAVMPADLDLPPVGASDDGQVALKDLYEVHVTELGALLRDVALALRPPSADEPWWDGAATPLATSDDGEWVRIHLTQLPFPDICAGCGEPTPATLECFVYNESRSLQMPVPFCDACRRRRNRSRWVGAAVGAVAAAVVALVVAVTLFARAGRPAVMLVVGVMMGLTLAIPGAIIGQAIARALNTPVRWKDYRPEKGTVKIRFRSRDRSAALIAALGLNAPAADDETSTETAGSAREG